jgi:type IV pilus assembly protein PilM
MDVAALDGIVQREARRVIGASLDDSYLHWRALPVKTRHRQVYVLIVPKEPLHALMKALQTAGLKPKLIDLKPLALMRAVNRRDAIIANGESNSMETVIVVDDIPALVRGTVLSEGAASPDYAVGRISDELVRTIAYYNDSHRDDPLDPELPIYLTGSLATSVPFSINVATLTGRAIEPLEPPLRYPDELPVAEYMVNMGLVIRAL